MLLDCGAGTLHGMARERLSWRLLSHLFISHFHTDHVGDLAALFWALRHGVRPARTEPLVLLGPRGLRAHMEALARAHGEHMTDPGFPVEVAELEDADLYVDATDRFAVRVRRTPHTDVSLAVRVETPAGTLGYTGDTGPSAALGAFFRGVSALVSECSLADPAKLGTHLSPRTLAELAGAAAPGLLVVTHLYPPLRRHQIPDLLREAGYEGEVLAAIDGTTLEIEDGRALRVSG
jgi:ribonuclease BN (tRNA processing enzyme)